jgi:hypothetical protein
MLVECRLGRGEMRYGVLTGAEDKMNRTHVHIPTREGPLDLSLYHHHHGHSYWF